LDEIIIDEKTRSTLKINSTSWSKLSYWNAYNIMMNHGSSNIDDMRNIVYMLKHDVYEHKKKNKDIWKKHITDAIFKQNVLVLFQDINYNGPMIKQYNMSRTSLKDLTIILLEHRIEILKWLEEKKVLITKVLITKVLITKVLIKILLYLRKEKKPLMIGKIWMNK